MAKKRDLKPRRRRDVEGAQPAARDSTEDDTWEILNESDAPAPAPAPAAAPGVKKYFLSKDSSAAQAPASAPARVVSLDNRKLSKKQRESITQRYRADEHGRSTDGYFADMAAIARTEAGNRGVWVGAETNKLLIGIPMFAGHGPDVLRRPGCLPMEFVLAQSVFPLGVIIQVNGLYGSGKSGILAEFARWFDIAGGGTEIHENETKFSPEWYLSILGPEAFSRVIVHRCRSPEDWQQSNSQMLRRHKLSMTGTAKEPGIGRTIPVLSGIDSIMGKMSEEIQEKILGKRDERDPDKRGSTGEGFAGRSYPIEAQLITKYLRTIPQELDGWPFAMVLINHLRINKDDNGVQVRSKTGGVQVDFQESFELEIKKAGGYRARIESLDFEGFPVEISCEKSSFGPTFRKAQTRVLWWEEEDGSGDWKQHTIWDWDWATVHLLNKLRNSASGSARLRKNLQDMEFHLDCPKTSDVENLAWSKNLGMKAADARPWHEVGAMIHADQNLLNQLRLALRIRQRPLLAGDYLKQMDWIANNVVQ